MGEVGESFYGPGPPELLLWSHYVHKAVGTEVYIPAAFCTEKWGKGGSLCTGSFHWQTRLTSRTSISHRVSVASSRRPKAQGTSGSN
jgi:hypothetical protein